MSFVNRDSGVEEKQFCLEDYLASDDYSSSRGNESNFNQVLKKDGILGVSDLHGNFELLEKAFQKADEYNYALYDFGDVIQDYNFEELYSKSGFADSSLIKESYLKQNLSEQDFKTLNFVQIANLYGIENIVASVPVDKRDEVIREIEFFQANLQSDVFNRRLKDLENKFLQQGFASQIYELDELKQDFHQVLVDEHARVVAGLKNKYENVPLVYLKGNHDTDQFVENVREYVSKPEDVVDLNRQRGYLVVDQKNGEQITTAGISNTTHLIKRYESLYKGEKLIKVFKHLIGYKGSDFISSQNLDDDVSDFRGDDYVRIKEGNEGYKLDLFCSHGPVGENFVSKGRKGMPTSDLRSARKLAQEADYLIEGHVHSVYMDEKRMRAPGSNYSLIRKNDAGELERRIEKFDVEFLDSDQPLYFDISDLRRKTVDRYLMRKERENRKGPLVLDISDSDVMGVDYRVADDYEQEHLYNVA